MSAVRSYSRPSAPQILPQETGQPESDQLGAIAKLHAGAVEASPRAADAEQVFFEGGIRISHGEPLV